MKTKEEILNENIKHNYSIRIPERIITAEESAILKAMEDYAKQTVLRLIKYKTNKHGDARKVGNC